MKKTLRAKFLELRKNSPQSDRETASAAITEKIIALAQWKNAGTICIYKSFPSEVDTRELIAYARRQGKAVQLPPGKGSDLYLVPGVVFDRDGYRIGRGGGYYDRLLAGVKAAKIGLAFAFQMVAKVPHSSYDVPMDMVVTEKEIVTIND